MDASAAPSSELPVPYLLAPAEMILCRDSGVAAIESLMEKRGKFDYILLETTGLADPGNIAPLFWVDEGLGSTIYLDGIVTLVDAKNILKSLDQPQPETVHEDKSHSHKGPELTTAHLQISHADMIVLNKSDLVTEEELQNVKNRIRAINALASICVTTHSRVPSLEGVFLDVHAYDEVKAEDLEFASKGHSHLDPTISTISLKVPILDESNLDKLDVWLRSVLWDSKLPSLGESSTTASFEIHRTKGRVLLSNGKVKLVQGVREVFDILDDRSSNTGEQDGNLENFGKLVLIGRGLDDEVFNRDWAKFWQSQKS